MSVKIFFDCGAPSLYNRFSKVRQGDTVMGSSMKNRKWDDFSYVETEEYKLYRQGYVDWIKQHEEVVAGYSNLDVINNPELTYENQKWLEAQGVHPLPVWHFGGGDVKWLRRYIDEGYDYICIGGMHPTRASVLIPALDRLWQDELTDKDGMPRVKVHGFAMTSFDIMYRYPWYSVDSKTWIDTSRFGRIFVPFPKKGKPDWKRPMQVSVTYKALQGKTKRKEEHLFYMPTHIRKYIIRFLESIDVPLGRSEIKKVGPDYKLRRRKELWHKKGEEVEVILEHGVTNTLHYRKDVNIILYKELEKIIPEWPWSIFRTVKPGSGKGLFK